MTIENIRDTGRNSARTVDVRVLAEKIQKPSDTEAVVAANAVNAGTARRDLASAGFSQTA